MQPTMKPTNGAPTKGGAYPVTEPIIVKAIAWLRIGDDGHWCGESGYDEALSEHATINRPPSISEYTNLLAGPWVVGRVIIDN